MVDYTNTIMDLTTNPDCDPSVEDCVIGEPLKWPEHSPHDLYIFAAVSFANSVLPAIYYNISSDYSGNYNGSRGGRGSNMEAREG